jgi:hypothetical protein
MAKKGKKEMQRWKFKQNEKWREGGRWNIYFVRKAKRLRGPSREIRKRKERKA